MSAFDMCKERRVKMIKNVILDMGNVLLSYDPNVILDKVCETEEEKQLIRTHLFESEIWLMGDRGEITNGQRYDLAKEHLPKGLHPKLKECVKNWDICMLPIAGAKEFCHRCREAGYHMYVLSNACNHFYDYFPKYYEMDFFDGVMVSSDVHLIKPDTRIYELLCRTYDLKPQECIFIDDRPENVEAAERVGMKGIVFTGDYATVEDILRVRWNNKANI